MADLTILKYEVVLHWLAVGFYIVATGLFAYGLTFQKEKPLRPALLLAWAGLLFHSAAIGLRWWVTGHGPYLMIYEILSSNAWVVIAMFLLVSWKSPRLRSAGAVALPVGFLMMTVGLFMRPEIKDLPPSLRGIWLVIHVSFNHLAVGALIIACGASVIYLLKERKGDTEFFRKFPSLELLNEYGYRFAAFGFIFWSITLVAGAIWANQSWGRYWGWDPVETWSFITWLLYGLYLHSVFFFKIRGKTAAWMLIACFFLSILSIYLVPFTVKSLHSAYF